MKKINLEHMIHTLRGENTWITARQLSTLLHISTRSVRNYVTEINKMHPEPLIEASRYGYRIVVREQRLLLPQEDRKEIPDSPQGRVWYLARQIIYRDSIGTDPLSFDEGTDRLRISDRSMEKDINQLRKLLSDYGVRLRASCGILTIQGKEGNVRNLIYDCICHFASDRMLTISDILRAFPGFPVEAVSTAVSETVDRAGMICDPYHRNGLLLYLIIQSIRIRNHHLIRPGDFRGEILETLPRNAITRRLAERLGTSLGVSFSASELDYLSVLLFCFCAEKNPSQEKYVDVCNRLAQDLQHLSNWIGEPYDGTLICTLADMLVRMRVRSLMGIRTFHPLSSPLRNEMPQLYDSVVWILGDFEALWNVRFDRYDISAFALPICIYARLHQGIAPRICCTLICPDTMGLTSFILEKLECHFGSQLEITDVIDSLDFLDLPENEMLISLIPLKKISIMFESHLFYLQMTIWQFVKNLSVSRRQNVISLFISIYVAIPRPICLCATSAFPTRKRSFPIFPMC